MAKYKALKKYYSGSQGRELVEGEMLELNEADSLLMDERIKSCNGIFLEKIEEEVKKRGPKPKVKDGD